MKQTPTPAADRLRSALAIGLATLLTVSASAQGADSDALRRLQEENAALRKQLAEIEGRTAPTPAAPAPTSPAAAPAAAPAAPMQPSADPEVTVLSPFTVRTDRDYGYLKTNSATATRIGTEIQKVPLSISVLSEDFIKDTNLSDIQDVLRYQSSSAGDTRMGVLQPATGFTPSGNMSLRGFPINSRLRNGLLRYNNYTLDNVDRVEVIKGPAAVFFGQAFPGGVINYVTKQPEFRKIPTSLTYGYGGTSNYAGTQRLTLDHNAMLSNKAAFRVVGAWDNAKGDRRFEFQDGFSVTPSFAFLPFEDGRMKITVEGEFTRRARNQDDTSWSWPAQWFADYAAPPAALIAAAGLSGAADPVAAYRTRIFAGPGNWFVDRRTAANNPYLPGWTEPLQHGAFITNRSGQRVFDSKFNYYGVGTYSDEENTTFATVVEYSPFDWVSGRYAYTLDNSRYTEVKSSASPNADGITWQTMNGILARDYVLEADNHQLDLVFKQQIMGVDNKLLVGGLVRESYNTFTGTNAANLAGTGQFPFFGNLPGSFDKPDEGYVSPIPAQFRTTTFAGNFNQQFVRNRTGQILTPMQIFSQYDPGFHPSPDIRRITEVSRGLTDHSRPKREEWYINWQGSAFENRLTAMAGYREEKQSTVGQLVKANPPWFEVGDFALQNVPQNLWAPYGLSAIFSRPRTTKGDSKMGGLSFEVTKNINVYASYSETFLPSGVTFKGGDYDPATVRARATANGLNPDAEVARLEREGGLSPMKNETGKNLEFGVKTSLWDNKLVSTASIFRLDRENRTVDDSPRQNNEPLNWLGAVNTGTRTTNVVRWFSNDAVERTEGAEFEAVWTPIRNYQAVISGSWIWTADTLADPSVIRVNPNGTVNFIHDVLFSERLPFVPEYRFNIFQKYTFVDDIIGGFGRGFSAGLGMRYSSEMNISIRDMNFNPKTGGLTAGDYVVFDTVFSYPFEVFGYKMTGTLNVNNVLDEEYSEGGFNLSPPRQWLFTVGMKF
jgi:outer membrane receptor protein involved in Fe transport